MRRLGRLRVRRLRRRLRLRLERLGHRLTNFLEEISHRTGAYKGPAQEQDRDHQQQFSKFTHSMLSRVALMHVLGGNTRRYESDEKRIGAVHQLITRHDANVFSALSSDILVTDYPHSGWR